MWYEGSRLGAATHTPLPHGLSSPALDCSVPDNTENLLPTPYSICGLNWGTQTNKLITLAHKSDRIHMAAFFISSNLFSWNPHSDLFAEYASFPPLWKLQIVAKVKELIFSFNIYFMGRQRKRNCLSSPLHCEVGFLNQSDRDTVLRMIPWIIETKIWALLINRPWLIIIKHGFYSSVHFNNSCRRLTMSQENQSLWGLNFSQQCHNK